MTDRELLELAAKAAGFNDAIWAAEQACITTAKLPGFRLFWNPLSDDGDAMRLSVKLNFKVYQSEYAAIVSRRMSHAYVAENHDDDRYAATRRAIVRAAAELGKEVP